MDLNLEKKPPKSRYNFDCVISCAFDPGYCGCSPA